jgi:hypothetical protein
MYNHGYGQSKQGKIRRADKFNVRLDKWIKTCLRVNKEIENHKEVKNEENT